MFAFSSIDRLLGPTEVAVDSPLGATEVKARLRTLLESRASMESAPGAQTDRRLGGSITDSSVRLVVFDANLMTRRKAWNIEFQASIVPADRGAVLRGTIDIADRRRANEIVWGIRAVVAVVALAVLVQAINQAATGVSIVSAVVIGAGLLVGSALLEAQGHRDAARDAQLLVQYLRRALS